MRLHGQLAGHNLKILDIIGVDNTIWSTAEDQSVCIWDIHVSIISF